MRLHQFNRLQIMTQSMFWLYLYHSVDQVESLFAHYLLQFFLGWPLDISGLDIPIDCHRVCAFEGNSSYEHLEKDASQGPCVDSAALIFAVNHFWRLIVDCSNEGASPLSLTFLLIVKFILYDHPGVSKVDDFDIVVCVHHYVLRL